MNEDDDELAERIETWLDDRKVPNSIFITYPSYGEPGLLTVLLPGDHAAEAVYLTLWPQCCGVSRM